MPSCSFLSSTSAVRRVTIIKSTYAIETNEYPGRRRVERTDRRFLDNLRRIQADDVRFVRTPFHSSYGAYSLESKQDFGVEKMCLDAMVREKKLYD